MSGGWERAAAGAARRAVAGILSGGASLVAELKFYVLSAAVVLVALVGFMALLVLLGHKAAAETQGVSASCVVAVSDGPPAALQPFYDAAAAQYHLGDQGWAYLAAINKVESDFGRSTLQGVHSGSNRAGAAGPMQMGIGGKAGPTWQHLGADGDGDGIKDVYNPADAIAGAANKLSHDGAPGDWHAAIYAYNHADWYVNEVQDLAAQYLGQCTTTTYAVPTTSSATAVLDPRTGLAAAPADAPEAVQQIIAAANQIANKPYVYGGGHGPFSPSYPGYDCSGLTSFALHGAGLLNAPLTSWGFAQWGAAGKGDWVTIYATTVSDSVKNVAHVFMIVAGLRLDTGGGDRHGTAWRTLAETPHRRFSGFVMRHPPGL